MLVVVYILLFVLGCIIGSFLNVVIDRLPQGKSIIFGRSHCDHCKKTLSFIELIPLVSYFIQKGRCRHCKKKLSAFYPIVEGLTGCIFLLVGFYAFGFTLQHIYSLLYVLSLLYTLLIFCLLIIIFFTDYKYGIIPFNVVFLAAVIAVIWNIFLPVLDMQVIQNSTTSFLFFYYPFQNYLFSGLGAFGFFFILFLGTRGRGMGFGDVVYAFLMGLLLGYPKIVVGMYIAFLTGAAISLILVFAGTKKLKGGTIPFGPFLVAGTVIALIWGQYFISVFLSMLHA